MSRIDELNGMIRDLQNDKGDYRKALSDVNRLISYLSNAEENIGYVRNKVTSDFLINDEGAKIDNVDAIKEQIEAARNKLDGSVISGIEKAMANIDARISSMYSEIEEIKREIERENERRARERERRERAREAASKNSG